MHSPRLWISLFICLMIGWTPLMAQPSPGYESLTLTDDEVKALAEEAMGSINAQIDDRLKLSFWAPSALVADPIALFIDNKGRTYYSRTRRHRNSEFDIRDHTDWMTPSISWRTVEDRRAFLHKELAPERSDINTWMPDLNADGSHDWRDLKVERESVYLLSDASGDGMADTGLRVVDDFQEEISDVAGAIMTHQGDMFVGVGPDMWRMKDTDGDGIMDEKTSISHGYSIHVGFSAHSMSGLTIGPEGKLYWGVGDIGFHGVDQTGKLWDYSNQGVIVRSNPDGSDFEVFAAGVRNTHEFVFDKYGNLISVDNDGDHAGEHERLVYIVNGSDSGWRTNWQFGKYTDPDNNGYKVWMDEDLYKPRWEGQAAYITPPVAAYHAGPTGMTYNPGTAWGEAWNDNFFISVFRGSPTNSHVYAFRLEPKGAGFALKGEDQIVGGLLITGIEFGPDGAMYAADWTDGWAINEQGRMWKLDVSENPNPMRDEVAALLGLTMADQSLGTLTEMLHHDDMRVRQEAQFELASRGKAGASVFKKVLGQRENQLARIHGAWGLWQMANKDHQYARPLMSFLADEDAEIRAQAAKVLGDVRFAAAGDALTALLTDESDRVRFFAAEALGRIGHWQAFDGVVALLEANNDADTYLRHAGSLALARMGDDEAVEGLSEHPSRAVRIAAVVALRRMKSARIATFLADEDAYIVTEAVRGINDDGGIMAAMPALARVLDDDRYTGEPLIRRAINANHRIGHGAEATRVAAYAARSDAPEDLRLEALAALSVWANPSVLDRVDGIHHGPVERDPSIAEQAFAWAVDAIMADDNGSIRAAAILAAGKLRYKPMEPTMFELLQTESSAEARIAMLTALKDLESDRIDEAASIALQDADEDVRMAALDLIPSMMMGDEEKAGLLATVLADGEVPAQQRAIATLAELGGEASLETLDGLVSQYEAGTLNRGIILDVDQAVAASDSDELKSRMMTALDARLAEDPMAAYEGSLEGGNATAGRRLFFQHPAAQCTRCHGFGPNSPDVGPRISGVGERLSREALLLSMVDPSAELSAGFGLVTLSLSDGSTVAGTVESEDDASITIRAGDGETTQIAKDTITSRTDLPSSMPPMGTILSKEDLRDLVEYLAGLD